MQFRDISTDTAATYRLKENEQAVFFMLNRGGDITFDMNEMGAEAHIFSFFLLSNPKPETLRLTQKHRAPKTLSKALVKAALTGQSSLSYEGLITVEKKGNFSESSQESRALLLSKDAHMFAKPSLEILAPDVRCHHAAASSPLNKDSLFFAQTRGLSLEQSKELLIKGFFYEAIEKMQELGVNTKEIENKLSITNDQFTINAQ